MLTIQSKREPVWVDLPGGARIQFKPFSTFARAAGAGGARAAAEAGESADVATVGFTVEAAKWGALTWEGIGDENGALLTLTPENLEKLLEQSPEAFAAVQRGYVLPGLQRDAEKNGSSPAQPGGSRARPKTLPKRRSPGAGATTARPVPKPAPPARSKPTVRKPK